MGFKRVSLVTTFTGHGFFSRRPHLSGQRRRAAHKNAGRHALQQSAVHAVDRILFDVHDLLERLAELRIEDGVDDRVDEAVHVAEPGGENERGHARRTVQPEDGAHGVHYVAREKRHPAYEEHACCGRNRSGR